jgi:hypothetical protein
VPIRLDDDDPTIGPVTTRTPAPGGFTPGAIVAGRYRLVALLGRGGMGEVYRADDLTLDQPVALKFLPAGVAGDDSRLAQFHNELRTARQVSHRNVVRLYDLGDADGRRFLTMEYVDGEDLASLLRRIGRIPQDKALEIARQLCAGVAAAHERGVLHRDLKPANVMIDGNGDVRITDFGIATASEDTGAPVAGTPQYMAPEQLAGTPASIRTDIYALGLILFEIFTGRRAYDAKSLGDLKQLHDTGTVTTPSSIVRDLDPAIERVILRCLARHPDQRPSSALTVAASLPGGDPLAAALAAGETPSPAMLVAAGESDALDVGRGLAAVAFVVLGVIVIAALSSRLSIAGLVPLDKPPAVLADRAQQVIASLGYADRIGDSAFNFGISQPYLTWLAATDKRPDRWNGLRTGSPATMVFWYRTSPRPLMPTRTQMNVTTADPPMSISGMTLVILDTLGRLQEFHAVPPQFDAETAAGPPRWEALFEAAGLKIASFSPATPQWTPRDFADARAAWEGPLTDRPEYRVRVEAAAYRGRPVSMLIVGPWLRPLRMEVASRTTSQVVLSGVVAALVVMLILAALLIARHNIRAKRADAGGAARLARFVMAGYAAAWVVSAHHVPDINAEVDSFARNFGPVLLATGILWVIYVALEPYVRRFWPDGILGWMRLMSGHVRDPRVGRDVLIGCVVAVGITLLQVSFNLLPALVGRPPAAPLFQSGVGVLMGSAALSSVIFDQAVGGLFVAMLAVLAFVLLRLALRRTSLAVAAALVLLSVVSAQQVLTSTAPMWMAALLQVSVIACITAVVVRYGLLVTAVAATVGNVLSIVPLTPSLSHWTASTSNLTIAMVLGLTLFGFYASRAGQPLFGRISDMAHG